MGGGPGGFRASPMMGRGGFGGPGGFGRPMGAPGVKCQCVPFLSPSKPFTQRKADEGSLFFVSFLRAADASVTVTSLETVPLPSPSPPRWEPDLLLDPRTVTPGASASSPLSSLSPFSLSAHLCPFSFLLAAPKVTSPETAPTSPLLPLPALPLPPTATTPRLPPLRPPLRTTSSLPPLSRTLESKQLLPIPPLSSLPLPPALRTSPTPLLLHFPSPQKDHASASSPISPRLSPCLSGLHRYPFVFSLLSLSPIRLLAGSSSLLGRSVVEKRRSRRGLGRNAAGGTWGGCV
jgi:hypothetical protein